MLGNAPNALGGDGDRGVAMSGERKERERERDVASPVPVWRERARDLSVASPVPLRKERERERVGGQKIYPHPQLFFVFFVVHRFFPQFFQFVSFPCVFHGVLYISRCFFLCFPVSNKNNWGWILWG